MSPLITQLADAIVVALNGPEFAGVQLAAQRTYGKEVNVDAISETVALVVPAAREGERLTRGGIFSDAYRIDVGIGKKLSGTEAEMVADMDQHMAIAEAVFAFLRDQPIEAGGVRLVCVASAHEPVFNQANFVERKEFQTVMSFTYRAA